MGNIFESCRQDDRNNIPHFSSLQSQQQNQQTAAIKMAPPEETTAEAKWVLTLQFTVGDPIIIPNCSKGVRCIFPPANEGAIGTVEGPKLNGTLHGPGGDWVSSFII